MNLYFRRKEFLFVYKLAMSFEKSVEGFLYRKMRNLLKVGYYAIREGNESILNLIVN